jgi:hypothetical protein
MHEFEQLALVVGQRLNAAVRYKRLNTDFDSEVQNRNSKWIAVEHSLIILGDPAIG